MITTKESILENLLETYDIFTAEGYIEMYELPKKMPLLWANWNTVPQKVQDDLEAEGYELLWTDEWIMTEDCKLLKTEPEHYFWRPNYVFTATGVLLHVGNDINEWIEEAVGVDNLYLPDSFIVKEIWVVTSDLLTEMGCKKVRSHWTASVSDSREVAVSRNQFCVQSAAQTVDVWQLPETHPLYNRY
jgi:hypothetical protein